MSVDRPATVGIGARSVPLAHVERLAAFGLAWLALAWALLDAWLIRVPFQDAAAYWRAWHGPLYEQALPLAVPHFIYSPVAALALWPVAHLPLAAFVILWAALGGAAYVWLLRSLSLSAWLPAMTAGVLFALNGNIEWLLALMLVVGMRRPAAWLIALFTKAVPFVGFGWFLVRREWRAVVMSGLLGIGFFVVSVVALPGAWATWFGMLMAFHGQDAGNPLTPAPPLLLRLLLAAGLTVWAACHDRAALLPFAVILTQPDAQPWALGILAALPRLMLDPGRVKRGASATIRLAP